MSAIRHERPPEFEGIPLENILRKRVARFAELAPDWDAFADSRIEGRRRAQHRFIGAGGSGKHDPMAIPAEGFTLSVMLIPSGQGGSAHTHEVEEVFFVLKGTLTVFFEELNGERCSTKLGPWECISCPAGILHGFTNEGEEPVYVQTLIGKGKPGPVGFADDQIYQNEVTRTASMSAA